MKTIETTVLECGHAESEHSEFTRGYGTDSAGNRHCYQCCADADKKQMRDTGKICLYLTTKPDIGGNYGNAELSNWPGSFKLAGRYHKGRHNMARFRYDVWFNFEGQNWHGVQYGDNTQICHCRRVK